jgi:hypothetical protein
VHSSIKSKTTGVLVALLISTAPWLWFIATDVRPWNNEALGYWLLASTLIFAAGVILFAANSRRLGGQPGWLNLLLCGMVCISGGVLIATPAVLLLNYTLDRSPRTVIHAEVHHTSVMSKSSAHRYDLILCLPLDERPQFAIAVSRELHRAVLPGSQVAISVGEGLFGIRFIEKVAMANPSVTGTFCGKPQATPHVERWGS